LAFNSKLALAIGGALENFLSRADWLPIYVIVSDDSKDIFDMFIQE